MYHQYGILWKILDLQRKSHLQQMQTQWIGFQITIFTKCLIEDDGSYAEVFDGKGQKWGLHASGDDDFTTHRIRFEALS